MLTGRPRKAGVEVHAFPIHLEKVGGYEEAGWTLGASPMGQHLPERTFSSWREPKNIPDWEACKAYLEDSIACPSYLESWKGSEKAVWTWCILKSTASPRATIRQRDGSRHE